MNNLPSSYRLAMPQLLLRVIFFCLGLAYCSQASAQVPDSLLLDTLPQTQSLITDTLPELSASPEFKYKKGQAFQPIPKKALLYSLIPGGGQIYNRRWWKLPFVYGGLGTLGYFIVFNTQEYRRYRDAIRVRLDGDDMTKDEFTTSDCTELISTNQLQSFRDTKRKDLELTYIFFFIAYGLTSVEAFVDAHLQSFDVSDDLSLQIRPTIDYGPGQTAYPGLGLRFQLKSQPQKIPALPYFN